MQYTVWEMICIQGRSRAHQESHLTSDGIMVCRTICMEYLQEGESHQYNKDAHCMVRMYARYYGVDVECGDWSIRRVATVVKVCNSFLISSRMANYSVVHVCTFMRKIHLLGVVV